jgi:hypothetical protein
MSTTNTEQVADSPDNAFDLDAIAAELGISPEPAAPAAPTKAATEPDADAEPAPAPEAETDTADDTETDPANDANPEQTAGDDDADDEAAAETDDDDQTDAAAEEKSPAPDKIQKRIDRITAEKHELREQLDATKAEIEALRQQAEAKPPVVTIDPENPLSSFTDAAALEAELQKAQAVLDWTEDNRDGGNVNVAGEEKYYDADAVKQIRRNAQQLLRHAPKQQEYLRVRQQVLPEAQAVYPDFFKPGTTAKAFLEATLKQYPWITRIPTWELVVGDAFVGQQMRLAKLEQQQRKAAAPKAKKPPVAAPRGLKTPAPVSRPKVGGSEAVLRQKAEAVFKSGGNADAIAEYLEQIV